MPNYRRVFRPGGMYFLTLVTERRVPLFAAETARRQPHDAMLECGRARPFSLDAVVLLPDHLHLLITLPVGDADYPTRMGHLKSAFTRAHLADGGTEQPISAGRAREQYRGIWQPRFWEHTIRDEEDLHRHLDYIHYNPLKHGHVACPHAWQHSSFMRHVTMKHYRADWCCRCDGRNVDPPAFDGIDERSE